MILNQLLTHFPAPQFVHEIRLPKSLLPLRLYPPTPLLLYFTMTTWAILSGIEGNLAAYEAVLADIKRQRHLVEELYILGDVIAATPASIKVIQRIQSPRANEPVPQVCQGWWEEQLLILHGLGRTGEPTELIERYGMDMVKTLWDAIPREMVEWVRSLDFGFFELD